MPTWRHPQGRAPPEAEGRASEHPSQPGPTGSGLGPRTGTTSSGTVPPTWLLEE